MSDRTQVSRVKDPKYGYLGNGNVLRAGVRLQFTDAEVSEYIKCSNDVKYFARNYVKIISVDAGLIDFVPYAYQERMLDHITDHSRAIILSGRQSAKTTTVAVWILHACLFRGDQTAAILANKAATAREMLSRITMALENLPFFLQAGCRELNKGSITWETNSKIFCSATTGSSIRGKSVNILAIDELAFVENAEEFFQSTYPVVASGKTARVIITSTPRGVGNLFHKMWEGAVQGVSEFKPFQVMWYDVPGRDEEFKRRTIATTSQRQWDVEFECAFLGSTNTLLESEHLLRLVAGRFVSTDWDGALRVYEEPIKGHSYVACVDVAKGRGGDHSTMSVFDISVMPFRQVAAYRNNEISPLLFPDVVVRVARRFNQAFVVLENNNGGDVVGNALYYELEYENVFFEKGTVGVTTTAKTKRIGCSNLKDLIERGKLHVQDAQTILELSTFVLAGGSYAATGSNHDDMVMTLVLFAWFLQSSTFTELSDLSLRDLLFSDAVRAMDGLRGREEEAPPTFFSGNQKVGENEDNWLLR